MSNSGQPEDHCVDTLPVPPASAHTPIHRLNEDILNIIFEIVSKPFASRTTLDLDFPNITWSTLPIWLLSHVCRRWRQLIFSNPMLWSNIYLVGPAHTYSPLLLQQQLEYATASLSVNVNWSVPSREKSQKFVPFFHMLCEKSHLWVDVALKVPGSFIRKLAANNLPLPKLERLQLSASLHCNPKPIVFTAEQAPKLHSFTLHSQTPRGGLHLPWDQLKELRLRGMYPSDVLTLEIMDRLTSIKVLDFDGYTIDESACRYLIRTMVTAK